MIRCQNCGTNYEGRFCPECGSSQPAAYPSGDSAVFSQPAYTENRKPEITSVGGWIGWLMLKYLFPVIGVIIMLCTVKDESAKNYAKASLVLDIIAVVLAVSGVLLAIIIPSLLGK